jgi:hypothetical protein
MTEYRWRHEESQAGSRSRRVTAPIHAGNGRSPGARAEQRNSVHPRSGWRRSPTEAQAFRTRPSVMPSAPMRFALYPMPVSPRTLCAASPAAHVVTPSLSAPSHPHVTLRPASLRLCWARAGPFPPSGRLPERWSEKPWRVPAPIDAGNGHSSLRTRRAVDLGQFETRALFGGGRRLRLTTFRPLCPLAPASRRPLCPLAPASRRHLLASPCALQPPSCRTPSRRRISP